MDIAVLNDARSDLAERMAWLSVGELNYSAGGNAEAWRVELAELERRHGYTGVEATLEYYFDNAPNAESVPGLGIAVGFYLDSLWEWLEFGQPPQQAEGGKNQ